MRALVPKISNVAVRHKFDFDFDLDLSGQGYLRPPPMPAPGKRGAESVSAVVAHL